MSNENSAMTPYNFIPFPDRVVYRYDDISEIPKHDTYNHNLMTGYIDYKIKTDTPLFIGSGNDGDEKSKKFFNIEGSYIIPGSTMRGRIRTNAEILSSSYPEFIENKQLWYRSFADKSDKLKNEYKNNLKDLTINVENSLEDAISAGYLIKTNKGFIIKPAKEQRFNHSFCRIKEYKLRNMSFGDENNESCFMYKNINWDDIAKLQSNKKTRDVDNKLRDDVRSGKNKSSSFKAYQKKVYYKVVGNMITDISVNDREGYLKGSLINSSNLGNKQVHYLVFEKNDDETIKLSSNTINNFEVNTKFHQEEKELFRLNNMGIGDSKSIFYKLMTNSNKVDVFGFTPYLKIPYKNKIGDFKDVSTEDGKVDYVNGMFGMTEPESFKSRLMFDNAVLLNPNNIKEETYIRNLSNPKPTSFQLYLQQKGRRVENLINYNDSFSLRGNKFYYLKNSVDFRGENEQVTKVTTSFRGITNAEFKSRIYFENLNKDELGLLLVSIKPFGKGYDSIGQGKPYGFGRVIIDIDKLVLEDMESCFDLDELNIDDNHLFEKIQTSDFIKNIKKAFINEFENRASLLLNKKYKLFDNKNQRISAFHFSKCTKVDHFANKYMDLNDFKKREILDEVSVIIKPVIKKITEKETKMRSLLSNFKVAEKGLSFEDIVLEKKYVLVCSNRDENLDKLRPVFKNFKKIVYKSLEELSTFTSFDIVIFNNYSTDLEHESILEKMNDSTKCGFVFFNDKNAKIYKKI